MCIHSLRFYIEKEDKVKDPMASLFWLLASSCPDFITTHVKSISFSISLYLLHRYYFIILLRMKITVDKPKNRKHLRWNFMNIHGLKDLLSSPLFFFHPPFFQHLNALISLLQCVSVSRNDSMRFKRIASE